jgi:hypothetical protein
VRRAFPVRSGQDLRRGAGESVNHLMKTLVRNDGVELADRWGVRTAGNAIG